MNGDPFYDAKDEVNQYLREIFGHYEDWKRYCSNGSMSQVKSVSSRMDEKISEVEEILEEMDETFEFIKDDRKAFGIDDTEFKSRRDFVAKTRKRLKDIKDDLAVPVQRNHFTEGISRKEQKAMEEIRRRNDRFLDDTESEQERIYQDQDQHFDHLHDAVVRLGEVGNEMNTRLIHQNDMLGDMDLETDETNEAIGNATRHVDKVIEKMKANTGWLCIILLLIVFIIVSFLALSL